MSGFDGAGIGTEYANLERVAERLEADGHTELATAYSTRAATERNIAQDVRALGGESKRLAGIYAPPPDTKSGGAREAVDSTRHGADLADWLIRHGWTPPAHFNGRITE